MDERQEQLDRESTVLERVAREAAEQDAERIVTAGYPGPTPGQRTIAQAAKAAWERMKRGSQHQVEELQSDLRSLRRDKDRLENGEWIHLPSAYGVAVFWAVIVYLVVALSLGVAEWVALTGPVANLLGQQGLASSIVAGSLGLSTPAFAHILAHRPSTVRDNITARQVRRYDNYRRLAGVGLMVVFITGVTGRAEAERFATGTIGAGGLLLYVAFSGVLITVAVLVAYAYDAYLERKHAHGRGQYEAELASLIPDLETALEQVQDRLAAELRSFRDVTGAAFNTYAGHLEQAMGRMGEPGIEMDLATRFASERSDDQLPRQLFAGHELAPDGADTEQDPSASATGPSNEPDLPSGPRVETVPPGSAPTGQGPSPGPSPSPGGADAPGASDPRMHGTEAPADPPLAPTAPAADTAAPADDLIARLARS